MPRPFLVQIVFPFNKRTNDTHLIYRKFVKSLTFLKLCWNWKITLRTCLALIKIALLFNKYIHSFLFFFSVSRNISNPWSLLKRSNSKGENIPLLWIKKRVLTSVGVLTASSGVPQGPLLLNWTFLTFIETSQHQALSTTSALTDARWMLTCTRSKTVNAIESLIYLH